jgi:lysozyme family protein
MTASNFLACFNETESFEGGYVNDPHDPGGATLKGVTQAVYTAWLVHHGRPNAAVRGASDGDIQAIYRAEYWDAVRGDDLYDGLDLVMVDTGWGSGPITAIHFLQRQLGVAVDGQFGLITLAALKPRWNSLDLINVLCATRMAFFESLTTWKYFGVGWTRRLNGIHQRALEMNAAARVSVS